MILKININQTRHYIIKDETVINDTKSIPSVFITTWYVMCIIQCNWIEFHKSKEAFFVRMMVLVCLTLTLLTEAKQFF